MLEANTQFNDEVGSYLKQQLQAAQCTSVSFSPLLSRNATLTTLSLNSCGVDDQIAVELFQVLSTGCTGLKDLQLHSNYIKQLGASACAQFLQQVGDTQKKYASSVYPLFYTHSLTPPSLSLTITTDTFINITGPWPEFDR
jgi:hypothetical protein